MRRFATLCLLPVTLSLIACSESPAPTGSDPVKTPATTEPPAPPARPEPSFQLALWPARREVLVGDDFLVRAYAQAGGTELSDTLLTWRSSDSSIARMASHSGSLWRIRTFRAGSAALTATAGGTSVSVAVTVLPIHVGSVPVTVQDFHVVEWMQQPGLAAYAPVLEVRDTANASSELIALSFEVPGIGQSFACHGYQGLGPDPWTPLPSDYGDFWLIASPDATRAAGEAVAHLTVRLADDSGVTLDVRGPVTSGVPPSQYTQDGITCEYP